MKAEAQKLYLWLMALILVVFLPVPPLAAIALWAAAVFFARRIVMANGLDRVGLLTMAAGYPLLLVALILVNVTSTALGGLEVVLLAVGIMCVQGYGMWRLLKSIRPA